MITQHQFEQARDILKPAVVAAVVTKMGDKINLAPIVWQVVSSKYERPWVACVGLSHKSCSLAAIKRTKEFVLAFPSRQQIEDVLYCGTVSGKTVNKAAATNLKFAPSREVHTPCLKSAVLNLECRAMKSVKLETFTIVIGEIVHARISSHSSLEKIYALGNERFGVVTGVKIIQGGKRSKLDFIHHPVHFVVGDG